MSKIAGELNAEMTNAVRDKYRVLFAEMVRKTGSNQSVLDRLVQEIHSLREQIAELEASPLSEETLDILRSKNKQLERERDQLKEDYQRTCHLVAQMHMAAMNGVIGPKRGVIEDIADLREERDTLAAQNEALRSALEGIAYYSQPRKTDPMELVGFDGRYGTDDFKAAERALNLPNLAAEVLRKRDAETLLRAAEFFTKNSWWDVPARLRLMAAELEKETT